MAAGDRDVSWFYYREYDWTLTVAFCRFRWSYRNKHCPPSVRLLHCGLLESRRQAGSAGAHVR